MANQTAGRAIDFRGRLERIVMPIQASTKVFMGAAISRDSSGNVGVLTAGERFMGLAEDTIDNSSGAAALSGRDVSLYTRGSFLLSVSGAAAGDEDKAIFCGSDDQSFSYNPKKAQYVGWVEQYDSSGKVWVRMENPGSSVWSTWMSFTDDQGLDLPAAAEAIVIVCGGSNGGVFHVDTAGAVTKLSGTTNCVATNTDAKLCVFDGGTMGRVRNRLGSTQVIRIQYFGIG